MEKKCKNCWWQEGDLCYLEPVERDETGRSKKEAIHICDSWVSKREMLTRVIPNDKLIIISELRSS